MGSNRNSYDRGKLLKTNGDSAPASSVTSSQQAPAEQDSFKTITDVSFKLCLPVKDIPDTDSIPTPTPATPNIYLLGNIRYTL
jgi:hypothetical protein